MALGRGLKIQTKLLLMTTANISTRGDCHDLEDRVSIPVRRINLPGITA